MVRQVDTAMLDLGRMQPGEYVTIVAGSAPAPSGSTNAMHKVGSAVPSAPPYGRRHDPPTRASAHRSAGGSHAALTMRSCSTGVPAARPVWAARPARLYSMPWH